MSMPMSPKPSGVGFNRVPWEQSANPKPRQDGGGATKPFDNSAVSNMFAIGLGHEDPVTGETVGGGIQDNSGGPPVSPQQQALMDDPWRMKKDTPVGMGFGESPPGPPDKKPPMDMQSLIQQIMQMLQGGMKPGEEPSDYVDDIRPVEDRPYPQMTTRSDIRLKSNIRRIGTHPQHGIGIYDYDIDGHRDTGVMAQELLHVLPSAVSVGGDGYFQVDYSML